jgi:chemotaxis protein MotB
MNIRVLALLLLTVLSTSACVSAQKFQEEEALNQELQSELAANQVQIKTLNDELTVSMVNELLFPSGSADLNRDGKSVLNKIMPTLKTISDKRIEVRGYTDNVPIKGTLKRRYKSNWELSTSRATSVLEYLQSGGVAPNLLSARGFGEYQPVAPNDSSENRAKNRRTDIVITGKSR